MRLYRIYLLIHPSTGEDLGDAQPFALRSPAFLRRAHITALAGSSGRIINATGALTLIALSISGLAARRHTSASSKRRKNALTFHRSLALSGILWGVTGACLVFTVMARSWASNTITCILRGQAHTNNMRPWQRRTWATFMITVTGRQADFVATIELARAKLIRM
jgi:hypothetical protein